MPTASVVIFNPNIFLFYVFTLFYFCYFLFCFSLTLIFFLSPSLFTYVFIMPYLFYFILSNMHCCIPSLISHVVIVLRNSASQQRSNWTKLTTKWKNSQQKNSNCTRHRDASHADKWNDMGVTSQQRDNRRPPGLVSDTRQRSREHPENRWKPHPRDGVGLENERQNRQSLPLSWSCNRVAPATSEPTQQRAYIRCHG